MYKEIGEFCKVGWILLSMYLFVDTDTVHDQDYLL